MGSGTSYRPPISPDFASMVSALGFNNEGTVGAVTPTRWMGGTAAGPPVAGAHLVGDFVISADGGFHICTAAGTPGTWTSYVIGDLLTKAGNLAGLANAATARGNLGLGTAATQAAGAFDAAGAAAAAQATALAAVAALTADSGSIVQSGMVAGMNLPLGADTPIANYDTVILNDPGTGMTWDAVTGIITVTRAGELMVSGWAEVFPISGGLPTVGGTLDLLVTLTNFDGAAHTLYFEDAVIMDGIVNDAILTAGGSLWVEAGCTINLQVRNAGTGGAATLYYAEFTVQRMLG